MYLFITPKQHIHKYTYKTVQLKYTKCTQNPADVCSLGDPFF